MQYPKPYSRYRLFITRRLQGGGAGSDAGGENAAAPSPKPRPDPNMEDTDCEEYNKNLTEVELNMRESLKYVTLSEKKGENCLNCQFYEPDKFEGHCGGCQLFSDGAVSPEGYCLSWTVVQTG